MSAHDLQWLQTSDVIVCREKVSPCADLLLSLACLVRGVSPFVGMETNSKQGQAPSFGSNAPSSRVGSCRGLFLSHENEMNVSTEEHVLILRQDKHTGERWARPSGSLLSHNSASFLSSHKLFLMPLSFLPLAPTNPVVGQEVVVGGEIFGKCVSVTTPNSPVTWPPFPSLPSPK